MIAKKRFLRFGFLVLLPILPLTLGCGGKYDKPLEVERTPKRGAYNYSDDYPGFEGAVSMAIAGGSIFVAYSDPLAPRKLARYYAKGSLMEDVFFEGLEHPIAVGAGKHVIAVADSSTMIKVKIYELSGGDPVLEFSDPAWRSVGGLVVDDSGNVYVADSKRNFVRAYDSMGKPRFSVDLADSGFGIGHVIKPMGIYIDQGTLLISEGDRTKPGVQRISINEPQRGIIFSETVPFLREFVDEDSNLVNLESPVAVAIDHQRRIIVLDKALGKIIRFLPDGTSDAIVNSKDAGGPDSLPAAVSLGTYYDGRVDRVYCLEIETGVIHRWDAQW
ncbi:MAG: hypothetical protein ACUVUU_04880 [bacterium]